MIQRIISTATLALAFIGEVSATNKYALVDDYAGTNFFDMFDYYTGADPTTGCVSYTSKEVAENANSEIGVALTKVENGQAYMGVDYVNVVTAGRPSVRIQSKQTYTHGLIIADLAHMPASICGTWPAFWTVNSTNYPQYGEIDILENINEKTVSLQTLHTNDGCSISANKYSTKLHDNITTYNCDDSATSSIFGAQDANSACSGTNSDPNSYGTTFNNNGGGVYAMQWTSDVIRMWNFGPDAIPADITAGTPDPSTWTVPAFTTEGGVCNIDELFSNHKIIFDTTFCGLYAGKTRFWQETSCYNAEKYPTCDSYVRANPAAYKEAYWLINSVKVYQNDTLAATSAAAASSTSASLTTASQAESLLDLATSEAASITSVIASSSLSAGPCIPTGVLLSGQTACPASFVEASSTADVVASVSSIASIIPITFSVEEPFTANIIVSASSVGASSVSSIVTSASSIETSSLVSVLTTSIPYPHTTSTVYGTNTRTDELGLVVTETVILSTTICPITAAEGEATQSPSSEHVDSTTNIQSIVQSLSVTSASGNISSVVVIFQTATVIPEAYTTPVSEAVYTWSTTTTEGTSIAVPVYSSPSEPASTESVEFVHTTSAGASSITILAIPTAVVSNQTATSIPFSKTISPAVSSISLSGEMTSASSSACVASGALVSGETACPEAPIKAVSSSAVISSLPFNTSATEASIILSTATLIPMQSTPVPAPAVISEPQPETTTTIIFTSTYATPSFLTKPTSISKSTNTNSTTFQTITPSISSVTNTNILIDTATQRRIETFTFVMPSAYSATGTSDASAVTGYSYVDSESGVSRVGVKGGLVVVLGVMGLGLLL